MAHRTFLFSCAAVALCCGTLHASPVRQIGGPIEQVIALSDSAQHATTTACGSSPGFVNLPGATIKIIIPSGGPNYAVIARFTARGQSNSQTAPGAVRIVTKNRELLPTAAMPHYDVTQSTSLTPFALQRSINLIPGTHFVYVQYCIDEGSNAGGDQFTISDWNLTVEAAPL